MPMSTKRVVHTGANTQLGGLKEGFASPRYQVDTERDVKTEPSRPAAWHTKIDAMKRMIGPAMEVLIVSIFINIVDCWKIR
jgi:hypothetical protein